MSDVITKLKVKQPNGQFGNDVPIGVEDKNVRITRDSDPNDSLGRGGANPTNLYNVINKIKEQLDNKQTKRNANSAIADTIWNSKMGINQVVVTDENGNIAATSGISSTNIAILQNYNLENLLSNKLDKTLTSGNANKILITNASNIITTTSSATKDDLEKLQGLANIPGTNIGEILNTKQNAIPSTAAVSSVLSTNLSANKVLVSDNNGKISASSTITTTNLNSLNGQTASINTELTNRPTKTDIDNKINSISTESSASGITLNFPKINSDTSKTITINAATSSSAGLLTPTEKNKLDNLDNNSTGVGALKGFQILNNDIDIDSSNNYSTYSNNKQLFNAGLLNLFGLINRGWISNGTTTDSTTGTTRWTWSGRNNVVYKEVNNNVSGNNTLGISSLPNWKIQSQNWIRQLTPGIYMVALAQQINSSGTVTNPVYVLSNGTRPVFPHTTTYTSNDKNYYGTYGTLIITPKRSAGSYQTYIYISTTGKVWIKHWGSGATNNVNNYGGFHTINWIEINPAPINNVTTNNTTLPLSAAQGYWLNQKINNKGKHLSTGSKTRTLNIATNANVGKYFYIPDASLTLEAGTWLVFANFRNNGSTSIIGNISFCSSTPSTNAIDTANISNITITSIPPTDQDLVAGRSTAIGTVTISTDNTKIYNFVRYTNKAVPSSGTNTIEIQCGLQAIKLS